MVAFNGTCDVFGLLVCYDLALVDDYDPVADRLDLLQYVRGENDGVISSEVTDEVTDLDDLLRVKTNRGLVEDDDGRVVDKRLRDAYSLAVAL